MGLIRLILALAVVVGHNDVFGSPYIRPELAVELFFIMSGFYMALVLNTKYPDTQLGNLTFVKNRMLKLFPIYYLALLISLVAFNFRSVETSLSFFSKLFFIIINLIIIGTDLNLFLGVNDGGHLFFTKDFLHVPLAGQSFVLVPPAWSISVELIFYGISIWLLRKRLRLLIAFFACSLFLKTTLLRTGYSGQPWSYMFWPAELCCFIAGAIACRMFVLKKATTVRPEVGWVIYLIVLVFLCFHGKAANSVSATILHGQRFTWLTMLIFTLAMPVIFKLLKSSKTDRFLGDFSYPIYILHGPINFFYVRYLFTQPETHPLIYGTTYLIGVFLVSLAAMHFIEKPLERKLRRQPIVS